MNARDRLPVIIGVGQVNDRTEDLAQAPDACALMLEALRRAGADAGGGAMDRLDTLELVRVFAAPMERIPQALSDALPGLRSFPRFVVGHGTTPLMLLTRAVQRIACGEAEVCAIAGAEACRTDKRRAIALAGTGRPPEMMQAALEALTSEDCRTHRLVTPIELYPLFENAMRAHWGQTLAQSQQESAQLWAEFSRVAAANENAWIRRAHSPQEILEPGPRNRKLCFPYNTLMVANNGVNQGAAMIVASHGAARRMGISESRMVFLGASAQATESHDIRERENYHHSPSMQAALQEALARNAVTAEDCDLLEIYSCFPCVPKYARRVLATGADVPLSVSGGLTFAGAPIRNYMMHAACEMSTRLRDGGGKRGLLFANGGFMTEAHAIALGSEPFDAVDLRASDDAQPQADALRGAIPAFDRSYTGGAMLETYSVSHGSDGEPTQGTVVARTDTGARMFCRVPAQDRELLEWLTAGLNEPVGMRGEVRIGSGGIAQWTLA